MRRGTRSAVILALGLFALVAQSLLFREFLTAFEGNELGVGSFFGSWLLWVALGALAGKSESRFAAGLTGRFELLTLLYIPAFLLQQHLITHARELGGVAAYEAYPFARMFGAGLLVNAPISLMTGFLFTMACRWSAAEHALPVARVYVLETLGSFAGGILVTVLLASGLSAEAVFLGASLLLSLSAAASLTTRPSLPLPRALQVVVLILPAVFPLLGLSGLGGRWTLCKHRAAWRKLLPAEQYRGSFSTAQAKYLYGEREGEFLVMSWGGVSESVPNTEHASEAAALNLAQHPAARRILVVGPGSLSICARFLELPQVQQVVWLHPDPDYPLALLKVLPQRFQTAARRVEVPGVDVRRFLRRNPRQYDLILLNLPDATTLVLNRYWTREFFSMLKTALAERGVLGARISGAPNYMGGELVYLGCSALETLRSVFQRVVLKPGDESWLIASDGQGLSEAPAALRDRFAAIQGAAAVYPPEGLMSLYTPDRIEFQMSKYREAVAGAGKELLLNTDRQPKALLFSMLLAIRRAGFSSFADILPVMLAGGVWIAACPILLYGLLRWVYLITPRSPRGAGAPSPLWDCHFLIFSTGLAGMSLSVVLMFLYQSRFGSLFLHIGLISSLFMLGSCLGGLVSQRLVAGRASEPRVLLAGCLLAHLLLILLVLLLPEETARAGFAALFSACGIFVGVYFPIAAHRLRAAGRSPGVSGSDLEMWDHVGGAAGAVLTGWLLLPVLGRESTLGVLALLAAVNFVPALVRPRPVPLGRGADTFDRAVRPVGYTMVGFGALAMIVYNIVAAATPDKEGRLLVAAAKAMTGGAELKERRVDLGDGAVLTYFEVADSSGGEGGFLFSTGRLAEGVSGYGGPIVLAVYVARNGVLRDLRIVGSKETPAYVESLQEWLKQLPGKNVFESSPFAEVDAVSGATMTSEAVLRTLEQSAGRFAAAALDRRAPGPVRASRIRLPDREFLCLAALMVLAIVARRLPGVWVRRSFLLTSLLLTGLLLNLQYSTQQVMALLSLSLPGDWLRGSFLLTLFAPLLVLLVGNVYCGYVCPFGALQELVGDLRPARLATDPEKRVWRYGRAVKYVLLLLLIVLFSLTGDYAVLSADPLITVFSGHIRESVAALLSVVLSAPPLLDVFRALQEHAVLIIAAAVVGLSFFFRRFWCRNLCPAGAFLALLCGAKLLRKLTPSTGPARCDLGVRAASELDCLCCDRCRREEG